MEENLKAELLPLQLPNSISIREIGRVEKEEGRVGKEVGVEEEVEMELRIRE